MPFRRRFVGRTIVSLLAGVTITVALAWLAMFLPWNGQHWYGPRTTEDLGVATAPVSRKPWQIQRGHNAWHEVVSYWWMQISGQSVTTTMLEPNARAFELASLPEHMRPKSLDELVMLSWYHQTGWPLPAMTCSVHWQTQVMNADIIYRVEGGWQLPRDAQFNPRALPYTPVWPGIAIDVLLGACACWVTCWSVGALRDWHRARRNRCVHCGYSRFGLPEGAPCPECGGALPIVHKAQG